MTPGTDVGVTRARYASGSFERGATHAAMKEDVHIDRIAEAGAAWEASVRSYVRTWARPAEDGIVTPEEWRSSEAERKARSAYEAARDEYRLHLRGDPHEEVDDDGVGDGSDPTSEAEPAPQVSHDAG